MTEQDFLKEKSHMELVEKLAINMDTNDDVNLYKMSAGQLTRYEWFEKGGWNCRIFKNGVDDNK